MQYLQIIYTVSMQYLQIIYTVSTKHPVFRSTFCSVSGGVSLQSPLPVSLQHSDLSRRVNNKLIQFKLYFVLHINVNNFSCPTLSCQIG